MLVLTRKHGERIQVGENIVIRVIRTGKRSVQLGIEAPRETRVVRAEIAETPNIKERCPDEIEEVSTESSLAKYPRRPR
ncbi:UNVERIFIED_CONTAM: hypothetical protein GTU68_015715 [Idotea baltica]|nr:hypothetical protein [Idotea baltica]